ncbi:MAG: hypothetical protein JKX85_09495 [Phycisphaeraceae bacterium]|nr:hypothetical protein [Phycisphaeraceae bacterium]
MIIPTDKPEEHLERARPFIEAGLPVFIDKPLTDQPDHLDQFIQWQSQGHQILSTSAMRYAKEWNDAKSQLDQVGSLRLITMTTPKSWERYGIHALEGVCQFLEPGGWDRVTNTGHGQSNIVHCYHSSGVEVVLAAIDDMYGAFGCLGLYGTKGNLFVQMTDTFAAFRSQMVAFVDYVRTGQLPFEFSQTVELMQIIMAAVTSRNQNGKTIAL